MKKKEAIIATVFARQVPARLDFSAANEKRINDSGMIAGMVSLWACLPG
jgi:hypothetical protein